MSIKAVPTFERAQTASDQETHYGYVAFHNIALGADHRVQPADSPYYHELPCRNLLPFTTIEIGEIDIKRYGDDGTVSGQQKANPIKRVLKSARECAAEMESSYQQWAFVVLKPLTGFDSERAFRIFQTIQPFEYDLGDLEANLADAEARIEAETPYQASYQGDVVDLMPLNDADKAIALDILPLIQSSAAYALQLTGEKLDATVESMTSRFSGGDGKRTPDPLDRYLAKQTGAEFPKIAPAGQTAQAQPQVQHVMQSESAESIDLKRQELSLRERELALEERRLALEEAKLNPPAMATAPKGKKKETEE